MACPIPYAGHNECIQCAQMNDDYDYGRLA